MDEQIRNVVGLVVLAALGSLGTFLSRRKLVKAGIGANQGTTIRNLRDAMDGWREKYELEAEGRQAALAELAALKAEQVLERSRAAECRSDLDDERSKNRELERQLERRRRPRPTPRTS